MAVIKWTAAMSVGVPAVDRDHRTLVELINSLGEATEKEGDPTPIISEALGILIAYTQYHFAREEKMMEVCGYPDLLTHRREHSALTLEVMELKRRFLDVDTYLTVDEILSFLVSWLNHHILLQDMDYREYAEGNAEAEEAAKAYGEFEYSALEWFPARELNSAR